MEAMAVQDWRDRIRTPRIALDARNGPYYTKVSVPKAITLYFDSNACYALGR